MRNEILLKAFGLHFREIRKEQGFSQQRLAFEADVSLSQISRLERGLINPTISMLYALSTALDIPLKELCDISI